ncbi:MAG: hypothetical protein MUF54_08795 [Polyangiaceae bacterium]|jgi:hypothetical protein|nr:hypothetical protein [Polyangiaceae bacterium]
MVNPVNQSATPTASEAVFMRQVMLALGRRGGLRLWRQNVATVAVRDDVGRVQRVFKAGPPKGAADLSGIVLPEGWRLEIEVKSAHGKLSEHQLRWGKFIERAGGVYVLLHYDASESMGGNVRAAEQLVEQAITARRMRLA